MRSRSTGSSPLARGLRVGDDIGVGAVGIIPARAGFTKMIIIGTHRIGDHPRSRGVYASPPGPICPTPGSSPLARGLHARDRTRVTARRIIPARAGFTPGQEHHGEDRPGSSPLARGLRAYSEHQHIALRIIPARAGFTPPPTPTLWGRRDHPRSRGVYSYTRVRRRLRKGSSPLARGLLVYKRDEDGDLRIIPARAGFTNTRPIVKTMLSDHPRSRGVYTRTIPHTLRHTGSSPLARGLHHLASLIHGAPGIIPARAGFTHPRGDPPRRGPDHPRSRGVYLLVVGPLPGDPGSSPLARGLLHLLVCEGQVGGIIPARAGFTGPHRHHPRPVEDHPRSRGVYPGTSSPRWSCAGSSPLARGLQPTMATTTIEARIIPARAGFTGKRPSPRGGGWDHPRSRGVYGDITPSI